MTEKGSVLITGCSDHGIGSGLALAFQQRGYHVFATARNPEKMTKLKGLDNVTFLKLDISDKAQIEEAVKAVREKTGGSLNYLINNAGRSHFMPVLDDTDAMRDVFETNCFWPLAVTQAFAPLLIQAKGTLAFTSSVSGYLNVPYMGSYAGAKRACEVIADTLRVELSPFGVKVISIVTGAVKTLVLSYHDDLKVPDDSLYKPIEATIRSRARGENMGHEMTVEEFSNEVVPQIIQGEKSKIWYGGSIDLIKNTLIHMEPAQMDAALSRGCDLEKLKRTG